ncbi:MAG: hypothetical protein HUJ61_00395, partial [Bacilli bacterium]|nr:hypothetical protein [Bacilli bacterium]
MSHLRHIQLFRNGKTFESKAEAIEEIEKYATIKTVTDGEAILGRYLAYFNWIKEKEGVSPEIGHYVLTTTPTPGVDYQQLPSSYDSVMGYLNDPTEIKHLGGVGIKIIPAILAVAHVETTTDPTTKQEHKKITLTYFEDIEEIKALIAKNAG